MKKERCAWVVDTFPLYEKYHDEEWGVPLRDDQLLFEAIVLDGAQAGLSWATVLRKRENYRIAFDFFDPEKVAHYHNEKIMSLLENAGIIRNRAKIRSAVKNAQAVLEIQKEHGSLSDYLWSFIGGSPRQNAWKTMDDVPTETEESRAMSEGLRSYGCTFVGPTICYALMQATGMVNDHTVDCFRYQEVKGLV